MHKIKVCSLFSLKREKISVKIKKKVKQVIPVSRDSTILTRHVGGVFNVHNGLEFTSITVTDQMEGYKFGEFALTRRPFNIKKKKKKKRKKNK